MWLDQEMWRLLQNIFVAARHIKDKYSILSCKIIGSTAEMLFTIFVVVFRKK
jgi:hypothetical protein